MPKAHARLSPSSSERWLNCAGSIGASSRIEDSGNTYADEGTAAHDLLECCIRIGVAPEDFIDAKMYKGIEVTEEMAEAVAYAIDWLNSYLQRNPGAVYHSELEVNPGKYALDGRDDCWGTSDLVVETKDELSVIDYKHGAGVSVESEGNTQLLLYLIGRAAEMGWKWKRYRIVIIQPRARHEAGPIRETVYDLAFLRAFAKEAAARAARTDKPNAERVPGDYCRWCRAARTCKALAEENMRVATVEFSNMDDLPEVEMVDPNELDAVGIAYVIKHQDRIEAWLKAVAGYAVELMRAGRPIPGFKLVAGRKQRNWSEPEDEMRDIVLERTELELDTIAPRELLSVAKLEKLLKKKRFTTLFAEYVSETRGEPHIAPEDDPRPALNSAVEFLESPLE